MISKIINFEDENQLREFPLVAQAIHSEQVVMFTREHEGIILHPGQTHYKIGEILQLHSCFSNLWKLVPNITIQFTR